MAEDGLEPGSRGAAEQIRAQASLAARQAIERATAAAHEAAADPDDRQKAKKARRLAARARLAVDGARWTIANSEDLAEGAALTKQDRTARRRRETARERELAAARAGLAIDQPRPLKPTTSSAEDAQRELLGRGAVRPIARRY